MSKTEECGLLVRHRSERASYCCANFSGYEGEGFFVCAMHPAGPEASPCPAWDLVEDGWFPCGAAYVDGELVLAQADFLEACDRNIEIMIHCFCDLKICLLSALPGCAMFLKHGCRTMSTANTSRYLDRSRSPQKKDP